MDLFRCISLFFFNFSLSGLSPFGGQDDNDTMENIRKCDVRFPNEVFGNISDDGKDFIKKLLLKSRKYVLGFKTNSNFICYSRIF